MLDSQKQIVQSTLPALRQHGETITQVFYKELLEAHPELRAIFGAEDQANGAQAKRLAGAILAYAANLNRLDLLGSAVTGIAQRHVNLQVQPEHYPIVGKYLLGAIRTVLGEAATPAVLEAWAAAYEQLAQIMIAREAEMHAAAALEPVAAG